MQTSERDDNAGKEVAVLKVRLSLAQAFVSLLQYAYDALLSHGVNYRTLPEYQDTRLLDQAAKLPPLEGKIKHITWMERLQSGIAAAVRRKGFKKVVDREDTLP